MFMPGLRIECEPHRLAAIRDTAIARRSAIASAVHAAETANAGRIGEKEAARSERRPIGPA